MKSITHFSPGQSGKKKSIQPDETARLEQLLLAQLAPVAPHPAYVNDLAKRLSDQSHPIQVQGGGKAEQLGLWQSLLLISTGVVSGILLVVLAVRLIGSIFASRQARGST